MNYYPSSVEVEEIHKINPNLPVKAINLLLYEKFRSDVPKDFAKREGIIFVGGFGHPPNEDAVIWFIEKILPLIKEKVSMPFYIVGSKMSQKVIDMATDDIIVKGYVPDEELLHLYDTCRMAVIPLRYGAGVKGKVVEALYNGIPMVTTHIGIEGIPGAEEVIAAADGEKEFANKVCELYCNVTQLKMISDEYQKFVKENFSVEAGWKVIERDFTI